MKNINTLFTSILAIIILTINTQQTFAADSLQVTELENAKNIGKIRASGNVEVELNQSTTESVTIYDQYNNENALIQVENGELRISSYGPNRLKVVVNVKSISSIETNGDANVTSSNQINAASLTIHLKGMSTATLDAKSTNLETIADDSSKLTLAGSAKIHTIEISGSGKVDTTHFQATKKIVKIEENGEVISSTGNDTVVLQAPKA